MLNFQTMQTEQEKAISLLYRKSTWDMQSVLTELNKLDLDNLNIQQLEKIQHAAYVVLACHKERLDEYVKQFPDE